MVDHFGTPPRPSRRTSTSNTSATASATSFLRWGQKRLRQFPRRAARHRHLPPGQPRISRPDRLDPTEKARNGKKPSPSPIPTRWSAPTQPHHHGQRPRRARLGRRRHRGRSRHARPAVSMLIPEVIGFKLTGKLPKASPPPTSCSPSRRCCARRAWSASSSNSSAPASTTSRSPTAPPSPTWRRNMARPAASSRRCRDHRFLASRAAKARVALVEAYAKAQGMWRDPELADPVFTDTLELDLGDVVPSLAGPEAPAGPRARSPHASRRRLRRHPSASEFKRSRNRRQDARRKVEGKDYDLGHGDVVIAAITSCTNTSNPERADRRRPLARKRGQGPQAQAVGEDLARARLAGRHRLSRQGRPAEGPRRKLGFNLVGYGCTTCIGNSGPLPDKISKAINDNDLVAPPCCRATATSKAASTPT
jgi:hypothetical protein